MHILNACQAACNLQAHLQRHFSLSSPERFSRRCWRTCQTVPDCACHRLVLHKAYLRLMLKSVLLISSVQTQLQQVLVLFMLMQDARQRVCDTPRQCIPLLKSHQHASLKLFGALSCLPLAERLVLALVS